jgi:outer membrane protein assembly factor BamE
MAASSIYSFLVILAALTPLALSGCGSLGEFDKVGSVVTPYRMDIVQGNVVTREQVAYLKPGMSRLMVRDVLGTSLLVSVFHAQRWDYVFALDRQGAPSQTRRLTVFFKNDVLERVDADELPSEADFVATLKSNQLTGPAPAMEAAPERLAQFPASASAVQPSAALPATPTVYPPLEQASR